MCKAFSLSQQFPRYSPDTLAFSLFNDIYFIYLQPFRCMSNRRKINHFCFEMDMFMELSEQVANQWHGAVFTMNIFDMYASRTLALSFKMDAKLPLSGAYTITNRPRKYIEMLCQTKANQIKSRSNCIKTARFWAQNQLNVH